MTHPLDDLLARVPFAVLDGALASELENRGCNLNDALWSARVLAEQPALIAQVHRDYFEAGADIGISASYQASLAGYAQAGIEAERATQLMAESATLLNRARQSFLDAHPEHTLPLLTAGSVGPYGAWLANGSEYVGNYTRDEQTLKDFHRPRIAALLAEGVDILACETIPMLSEAQALTHLLEDEFPNASAWIAFSVRDEGHIADGTPIEACAAWLNDHPQIKAIGLNCTGMQHVEGMVQRLAATTSLPIVIYPNAGEHYDPVDKCWHPCATAQSLGSYASLVERWYRAGARIIGGCCRTTPSDTRTVAQVRQTLINASA